MDNIILNAVNLYKIENVVDKYDVEAEGVNNFKSSYMISKLSLLHLNSYVMDLQPS